MDQNQLTQPLLPPAPESLTHSSADLLEGGESEPQLQTNQNKQPVIHKGPIMSERQHLLENAEMDTGTTQMPTTSISKGPSGTKANPEILRLI